MDWSFVSDQLATTFRRERWLGADERRFVAETVYGMVRYARRTDAILKGLGVSLVSRAPDRERMVAYLLLAKEISDKDAEELAPDVDWGRAPEVDERLRRERDPKKRLAVNESLPDWLAARLVRDWGDEAEPLAHALNQRAPMTVRVNTLKATREELLGELASGEIEARAGRLGPWAVVVEGRRNLFSLDAFRAGRFEAQDEGSQLIAELVAPPPKSLVVDYCAGAGGKALALAATLSNRGRVVACDVDRAKLAELKRRAKRAGATNIQSVILDAAEDAALPPPLVKLHRTAHRVLVDAPCTGVGALRRNPEARWRLDENSPERMVALQLSIAERALELVRPGGRLVYATCSLLRAENQGVVETLLARHPDLEIASVKEVWGAKRAAELAGADGNFLEVAPHRHGTDGFFAAALRRRAA